MPPKLKVAVYCIGLPSIPSTRFRILQYLPLFKEAGVDVTIFSLSVSPGKGRMARALGLICQYFQRVWQLLQANRFDCLIVQKGLTPWRARGLLWLLSVSKKPFFYDIDDAVYELLPEAFPVPFRLIQNKNEPVDLMQRAACVLAGNAYLAQFCSKHNAACKIIPTAIDAEQYQPVLKEGKEKTVIGWSGSSSTNFYVNDLIPILNQLAVKYPFEFHIMSNDLRGIEINKIKGYEFKFTTWSPQHEIATLQQFDIGAMPLREDPWSRGKCALKALQYMALAIPTVCSPVGVNAEIIRDGENGFLAVSEETWYKKMEELIKNLELRKKIGCTGRQTVELGYSVAFNFPIFLNVLTLGDLSRNEALLAASRSFR